eukprot:CAMPEP_0115834124 /NCGR_PEP_ID=MMETSP0287-20121206/3523_1 /TAXON_ID=412157 /ORGANISM="Chrysochromulina rotalis, Strain UIO044" /LENGTH=81 /DNA_ID=CAMNT_0003287553 /DNA_START=248 /DNA_END=494 /DNA_ORIENTATION=-
MTTVSAHAQAAHRFAMPGLYASEYHPDEQASFEVTAMALMLRLFRSGPLVARGDGESLAAVKTSPAQRARTLARVAIAVPA